MTEVSSFEIAIELYKVNIAAQNKVKRNASKLAWLDATRRQADVVIASGVDLAQYEQDALEAANAFAAFVTENELTRSVVEIISAALDEVN